MQDVLKKYLVESAHGGGKCFSLTCAVCGTVWRSTAVEVCTDGDDASCPKEFTVEEAKKYNRMCTFCGRPVCLKCFKDIEGISLCTQCGQLLRKRLRGE